MERRARGGAQGFRRKGAGSAGLAGGGRDRTGGAESGGGAQDGANVAGILNASENHEKWSAGRSGCVEQFVESGCARVDESGDALRMLGVGKAFEEAVGGAQNGESHFRPANKRSEAIVMALAGFAEENRFDAAAGTKRFFDEADAFDADRAGFRGQTAAERHAEFLEPAVVAASEDSGRDCVCASSVAGGFAWGGHQWERNKFG